MSKEIELLNEGPAGPEFSRLSVAIEPEIKGTLSFLVRDYGYKHGYTNSKPVAIGRAGLEQIRDLINQVLTATEGNEL